MHAKKKLAGPHPCRLRPQPPPRSRRQPPLGRRTRRRYARSSPTTSGRIETKNLALFREVKPNLSAAEEKRLSDAFRNTDSQQVELTVNSIAIQGDAATVNVTRRDIITVRGRAQNGDSRPQSFVFSKAGGKWVIVQIGP